jgi:hypothetical protein
LTNVQESGKRAITTPAAAAITSMTVSGTSWRSQLPFSWRWKNRKAQQTMKNSAASSTAKGMIWPGVSLSTST